MLAETGSDRKSLVQSPRDGTVARIGSHLLLNPRALLLTTGARGSGLRGEARGNTAFLRPQEAWQKAGEGGWTDLRHS